MIAGALGRRTPRATLLLGSGFICYRGRAMPPLVGRQGGFTRVCSSSTCGAGMAADGFKLISSLPLFERSYFVATAMECVPVSRST
jgi:hypothetical protein